MLCEMKMRAVGFVMRITEESADDFQNLFKMQISPPFLSGYALLIFLCMSSLLFHRYPGVVGGDGADG